MTLILLTIASPMMIIPKKGGAGYSGYLHRGGRYQDPVYSLDFWTAKVWNDFFDQMDGGE